MLPPLDGDDEWLSSTRLREAVLVCLEALAAAGLSAGDAASCLQQCDASTAVRALLSAASAEGTAGAMVAAEQAVVAVEQAAASLKQHGYAGAAVRALIDGVATSAAALEKVGEVARAHGELVLPLSKIS